MSVHIISSITSLASNCCEILPDMVPKSCMILHEKLADIMFDE